MHCPFRVKTVTLEMANVTNCHVIATDILFLSSNHRSVQFLYLAASLSWVTKWRYTQICVAHGIVSWGSKDNDEAGELQLWCHERDNKYCLYASKTAGDDMAVCKVIDVLLFTSKSALTKSKRY